VAHRDAGGARVAHQQRDRERRDLLGPLLEQRGVLDLERADAADARADDARDALEVIGDLPVPAGVTQRLV